MDTVGLIRRLPHHLVEAFRSTLEEAASADIILHVSDISDPEVTEKTRTTEELLTQLGCSGIPVINVLNKCDTSDYDIPEDDTTVKISAATGEGMERLLALIAKNLPESSVRMKLMIPYDKAGLSAKIREGGRIFSEDYTESGILTDALVEKRLLPEVSAYSCELSG